MRCLNDMTWHACLSALCHACRRGKRQQKRYDVYVGAVSPEAQAAFVPRLNDEHWAAKWWPLEASQLQATELHPVVASPGSCCICWHEPLHSESVWVMLSRHCNKVSRPTVAA